MLKVFIFLVRCVKGVYFSYERRGTSLKAEKIKVFFFYILINRENCLIHNKGRFQKENENLTWWYKNNVGDF